jgi:hypothetical protein
VTPANPIEALPLARMMRESLWAYPIVETIHIVGFVILVGSVVMFDLRVLGLSKSLSVRALSRHLLPWSLAALVLIVPTGLLMFMTHATDFLANRTFQLKMGLLMAAGINAVIFRTGPYQTVEHWDIGTRSPVAAQLSVAVSIVVWVSIIACGRLLAYT